MKLSLLVLGLTDASPQFPNPIKFTEGDFDFPETQTEIDAGWSILERCGGSATAGSGKDQRKDPTCPNVLLINTDDMAWGDVSINNPSKMIPTPNLDKMVSKGINFRDGHSCTARCAPSRYCLMTGRYHFRRGDYHYKPMELEYGRKVLTHLFKRNNYHTMVVGKPQPVEAAISTNNPERTDFYFIEGTGFWGYDRSFTSRSYCCLPGGGYFVNDQPRRNFDKWAIFTDFRVEDEGSVQISPADEAAFWQNPNNYHLLDGYSVDGNPESDFRPTTYMAYWNAINNNIPSGLNRRRRDVDGKLIRRATRHNRKRRSYNKQQKQNIISELHEHRVRRSSKRAPKNSYVRFQHKNTGKVILANHRLISGADRSNYEFAVNGTMFDTYDEAEAARQIAIANCDPRVSACNDMRQSRPKRTQVDFDSRTIMKTFANTAIDYITEHVETNNPIRDDGESRSDDENQPFFLYLSFRAPHRPYSHDYDFDPEDPMAHMPYTALGKPGEQLGIFDSYIGKVMKSLHDLDIADNTLVFFTSDNGPDQGAFNLFNKMGHMRMVTMRGKKASVYEGGHRVPFLSWWPLGTHKALQGTNFDLPVGQVDFFATFADILNYPLPGKNTCTYAYDSDTAPEGVDPSKLGRLRRGANQRSHQYENSFIWTQRVKSFATNPCQARIGVKKRADKDCEWVTCEECKTFWDEQVGTESYRTQEWMDVMKRVFCEAGAGMKCVDTTNGYTAAVQIKTGHKVNYLKEVTKMGYTNTEKFWTKEEKTGFMLGWEGCMAEDSHSFADAFKVANENPPVKSDNNGQYQEFKTKLQKVPSKIYAGKLGDLSLRLGRYKLVRFNAPKDYRTGPTRQHLNTHTKHEGVAWLRADWGARCSYDENGNSLNPSCTVEPDCRNTTTFGRKTCMRDHFYQLWDLEKNFGEKVLCDDSKFTAKTNPNLDVNEFLGLDQRAFDMGAEGTKAPEKPSDKWGYGLGIESTPVGEWQNDCCVLNNDEKPGVDPDTIDMCSKIRIKKGPGHNGFDPETGLANDDNRREWTGGSCVPIRMMKKGNDLASFQQWTQRHEAYILNHRNMNYTRYGWSAETHFANWDNLEEGVNWELGYGCSGVPISKTHRENSDHINNQVIWDENLQAWRQSSFADKICAPPKPVTTQPHNVGCKVPDHNGPLAEGWESNSQWKDAKFQHEGRYDSTVANGEVSSNDFGAWTPFVNCLKGAMKLIEGQAYFPETREKLTILGRANYVSTIYENEVPVMDGPGVNGTASPFNERILAGQPVGSSKLAQNNAKNLWRAIKSNSDDINREFHGAGSRYIEQADGSDALIEKCINLRPSGTPDPYLIKPTYDLDQNLMGYYETNDQTGGQNTRLSVTGFKSNGKPIHKDERPLMKYYKKTNGQYLKAFAPLY